LPNTQFALHLPQVQASADPKTVGAVDRVVLPFKLWDTEAAAVQTVPLVGPGTRVLMLQNRIDSLAMLGRHLPPAQLRSGVIYVSAVIDRPGVIRSPGGLNMIVADAANGDPDGRTGRNGCAHAGPGRHAQRQHRADGVGKVRGAVGLVCRDSLAAYQHRPDPGPPRNLCAATPTARRGHGRGAGRRAAPAGGCDG